MTGTQPAALSAPLWRVGSWKFPLRCGALGTSCKKATAKQTRGACSADKDTSLPQKATLGSRAARFRTGKRMLPREQQETCPDATGAPETRVAALHHSRFAPPPQASAAAIR